MAAPRATFDGEKKLQAAALLAAGVTHRQAAAFLGLSATTISQALRRDRNFAREVAGSRLAMGLLQLATAGKRGDGNGMALKNSIKLEVFPPCLPPRTPP